MISKAHPLPQPIPSSGPITAPLDYSVVLLAEDDDVLRRALSDFLASEGFMVREASDVATLRQELTGDPPMAIVADVHLSDGDVSSVVRELSQRSEKPNLVLMSASRGAVALAGEYRVQLLSKPFDLDALVQALLVPLDERPSDPG